MSGRHPGRLLGLLIQVLAGVIVTIGLLGVTEFVCGFFVADTPVPLNHDPWRTVEGDAVSATLRGIGAVAAPLVKDINLLWRNQPGASRTMPVNPHHFGRDEHWSMQINSEGFRGPERSVKGAQQGVYRILCVGDSVTYGYNVDQDAAFPQRLAALLRERYPERSFEVINAGVPGWSWVQGLGYLETEGLALRPNLVIAAHGMNDQFWIAKITDSERIRYLERPWVRTVERLAAVVEKTNMYRAASKLVHSKAQDDAVSPGCENQIREAGSCHRVSLPEIDSAVREMHRLTQAAGVDFLVLNLDFQESLAIRGLRSAVEKDHIPFLDLVARFNTLRREDEDKRARSLGLQPGQVLRADSKDGPTTAPNSHKMLLRVLATDIEPQSTVSVQGSAFPKAGDTFEATLYDDGTHGDEVANDHVYSAWMELAGNVSMLLYKYYAGKEPEFQPLPPLLSTQHDRVRAVPGNRINPVEVFGDQFLMVERAHPDARGHAVIAAEIVEELRKFPSFAAAAGLSASVRERFRVERKEG